MTNNFVKIRVKEGEVEDILNRLTKAQEEIYKCYSELEALGVVVIEKEPLNISVDSPSDVNYIDAGADHAEEAKRIFDSYMEKFSKSKKTSFSE